MRKLMLAAVLTFSVAGVAVKKKGGIGSGSGPASVNGAIGGRSMSARDAISNVLHFGNDDSAAVILITNAANTCGKVAANQRPKNGQAIVVTVGTQSATGAAAPASPGTYPVFSRAASDSISGNVAIVEYAASDASCKTAAAFEGASGTVTLTNVGPGTYSGTFDVTFSGSGGHVTGSFSSSACAALDGTIAGTCT